MLPILIYISTSGALISVVKFPVKSDQMLLSYSLGHFHHADLPLDAYDSGSSPLQTIMNQEYILCFDFLESYDLATFLVWPRSCVST